MSVAFETARDFAAHELGVFPTHSINAGGCCTCGKRAECKTAGKHPLTAEGVKDATCDERQLLQWDGKSPLANWAVACDRVAVVDIDSKFGADPREVISEYGLTDRPGVWTGVAPERDAKYPNSLAGVRGAQIYCVGGVPGGKTAVAGVEIRGTGLYAILPGSRHVSGVAYEWMNGQRPWSVELEPIPDALTPQSAGTGEQTPLPAGERIPHGERHNYLTDFAVRLVRSGVTDEKTLLTHIKVEFAERCVLTPEPEPRSLRGHREVGGEERDRQAGTRGVRDRL